MRSMRSIDRLGKFFYITPHAVVLNRLVLVLLTLPQRGFFCPVAGLRCYSACRRHLVLNSTLLCSKHRMSATSRKKPHCKVCNVPTRGHKCPHKLHGINASTIQLPPPLPSGVVSTAPASAPDRVFAFRARTPVEPALPLTPAPLRPVYCPTAADLASYNDYFSR